LTINKYEIMSIEKATEDINIYRMKPLGNKVEFKPGQFVFLHILDADGNTIIKKPYSIASSPSSAHLEFCIKMVSGVMTSKLANLKVGDKIGVEGPMGHFCYDGQTQVGLVAAGTGVAPMVSILRYVAEKKLGGSYTLVYSTKTKDSIIYKEEFARLEKLNPNIKIVITLTREESLEWKGEKGRISRELIQKYVMDSKNTDWWLCGLMEMIKSTREILIGMGCEVKRVRIEGWG